MLMPSAGWVTDWQSIGSVGIDIGREAANNC